MTEYECRHAGDAAPWVLTILPADEAARHAEHLETCATCRAEVARLQAAADALVDVVSRVTPPAELRARLVTAVEAEARLFRAAEADSQPPRPAAGAGRRRPLALGLLAVTGLVAVGILIGVLSFREGDAPLRTVTGSVTDVGGGPRAGAAVVIGEDAAELVLSDLAAPPQGRVYQAWVVRPPAVPIPTDALFSVPRSGDTKISLPPLRDAEQVIVTAEPPQGSPSPTPPPLVVVELPR